MAVLTAVSALPIVLVVDDNPQNLRLVAELLNAALSCDLCFATSGGEALEAMESMAPDLILLDVNMPGMNGFDCCRTVRRNPLWQDIPVIFLTAQRDSDFIVRGFEAGGNDYVVKPFESRELLARVQLQLELKLKRDELQRRNDELEAAIGRIRRLEGIIPICMYCKKIRDDSSSWQRLENYISEHSDALFSHGVCPDCFEEQMSRIHTQ